MLLCVISLYGIIGTNQPNFMIIGFLPQLFRTVMHIGIPKHKKSMIVKKLFDSIIINMLIYIEDVLPVTCTIINKSIENAKFNGGILCVISIKYLQKN